MQSKLASIVENRSPGLARTFVFRNTYRGIYFLRPGGVFSCPGGVLTWPGGVLTCPGGVLACPGNWSTQILGAASVHLAAYSPITPYIEFAPAAVFDSPLRKELQAAGFAVRDGVFALPDNPGIGYELPDKIIERFRIG